MNNSSNGLCNHFAFKPPSSFDKFTGVILIFIIIVSLLGNGVVCYAFIVNSRLRVVTNYFIMNLAVSDILTAGLVISFDVDSKFHGPTHWKYGVALCRIWTTLYTISVPTSILTLCLVSIDRYKAISDPLGYRAGVTLSTAKALCLIAGIWIFNVFMALLPSLVGPPLNVTLQSNLPKNCPKVLFCTFDISPGYSAAITIITFIFPSLIMIVLYVRMYIIISKRGPVSEESVTNAPSTGSDSHRAARPFQMHYHTKVARYFAVIILVQLVCWYPFSIHSIVYNVCRFCALESSSARYFLLTIGYLSSAINPYLYAYQQRSFRQVFNKMWRVKT